jgi:hypothetical protein
MEQYIHGKDRVDPMMDNLAKRIRAFWNFEQHPIIEVTIRPAKSRNSDAQKRLFWEWMEKISEYFTRGGFPISKDDAHDLMCHLFLGYTPARTIGTTEVGGRLRGISNLNTAEMSHLMDNIDAWATDRGLMLPTPADSAHEAYLRRIGRRSAL